MALKDLAVKRLSKTGSRFEVPDAGGLWLRVSPLGAKTWFFRYTWDGRDLRLSIGQWPGVGLGEARKRAGDALLLLQQGVDPGVRAREARAKRKAAPTVEQLLDEFYEHELAQNPSGAERRRLLKKDLIVPWGNRKVKDITRRDAVLLIDKVRKRAPVGASRLQSAAVRMFNFAAERGIIEFSPLTGLRRPKEAPRTRTLTDAEIVLLWAALNLDNTEIDIYRPTKLAIKMILLTGQRPGEVSDLRWSEIDGAVWTIPAARAKNRTDNRVPLGPMALETLEHARMFSTPGCDFVFPSSYKTGHALSRAAMGKAVHRHWSEMGLGAAFTPHDLRRTVRTKLAEIGVADHIGERVLGHKLQGLMAVYNQHSYDAEKRAALLRWERRLAELLGRGDTPAGKVIAFAAREQRHG